MLRPAVESFQCPSSSTSPPFRLQRTNARRTFILDDEYYEIVEVEERSYEPDAMYFKVRTTEGKRYILRYTEAKDEWTLQSGFDDDALLDRPSISLVTVGTDVIRSTEKLIESPPGKRDGLRLGGRCKMPDLQTSDLREDIG